MLDHIGRNIDYARFSLTTRCNLRCSYCKSEDTSEEKLYEVSIEYIMFIVNNLVKVGIKKIRLTGGEPLLRDNIVDIVGSIRKVPLVKEITLTTNGLLLSKYALELKEAGLDRINISLDSLDENNYKRITRGGNVNLVLEGIREARRVGFKNIKINVVLIKGVNDKEINNFINLTKDEDITVRFIEQMPFIDNDTFSKETFMSANEVLIKCSELQHINNNMYKITDYKGKVEFISSISNPFCGTCNRIRITSDLKLKPCLLNDKEIPVLDVVKRRDEDGFLDILKDTIFNKPIKHIITIENNYKPVIRGMSKVGG